jgi:tetratricopeptide (TPR) repeat protein
MPDLQQRLDALRRSLQNPPADASATAQLERDARALLADAKNTPYESAAQALFAELARAINPGGSVSATAAATVRGLARRARIRIEIAGDEDDIDEAIDILAEALALSPQDPDVLDLLQDAAQRSEQANQRVNDLFKRYNVKLTPPTPPSSGRASSRTTEMNAPTQPQAGQPPASATRPTYTPPSQAEPPATRESSTREAPSRRTSSQPQANSPVDDMLSDMTSAYYAGEYQQTIDYANRALAQQPGNPTALEYRQKAEDNLIRGVVPDHRIPFDARVSYNRANSLVRAGNYDEAERLYREARDLAERNGILSWKDAEQALLDIQDLALSRELVNEGDRLMATDNWSEALRKYEGALRVVPNDPQTEERIEKVRRVQQDADQAAVQLSMLGGSLSEQVTQLQNVTAILARLRQLLPNSQRLSQLLQDAAGRLNGIKTQLHDQAQSALTRADSGASVEERLNLTNEALQLLELGVKLDPGDTSLSDMMLEARAQSSDMQRARQVMERAAALIAQNFDNELTQARSMLAGLRDYAQDPRYRTVVSDLLTRYVERATTALDDGDTAEAESWLETMREEPFNVLGRRAEVNRLEAQVRSIRQQSRVRLGLIAGGIIILGLLGIVGTRGIWQPIINPPPTPTASNTPTPSNTPLPSDTPTPTASYTPSNTPTWTWTPSPTVTPSFTPTASRTPTETQTPTETYTPSTTPTETQTPTVTPTPPVLCHVIVINQAVNVRSQPTISSPQIGVLPVNTVANVTTQEISARDGRLWYRVEATIGGGTIAGYIRSDTVTPVGDPCPSLQ